MDILESTWVGSFEKNGGIWKEEGLYGVLLVPMVGGSLRMLFWDLLALLRSPSLPFDTLFTPCLLTMPQDIASSLAPQLHPWGCMPGISIWMHRQKQHIPNWTDLSVPFQKTKVATLCTHPSKFSGYISSVDSFPRLHHTSLVWSTITAHGDGSRAPWVSSILFSTQQPEWFF